MKYTVEEEKVGSATAIGCNSNTCSKTGILDSEIVESYTLAASTVFAAIVAAALVRIPVQFDVVEANNFSVAAPTDPKATI